MSKKIRKFEPIWLLDIVFLAIIVSVGWFLIGYYLEGEYLFTGYQDWIYHAFRVQSLDRYGFMPSWDHIWSNGINHWRSYQYMQHWLVYAVSIVGGLSIPKAMLWVSVGLFILLRVAMYGVMRALKIKPAIAFLATLVSYAYAQQWISLSDFSIFAALIIVPFYIYLWVHVYTKYQLKHGANMKERRKAELVLALISGGLWIVHPVVANALGGLFLMSVGFRAIKIRWRYFWQMIVIYVIGALPFLMPYLSSGYHFSNPMFVTTDFLKDTITGLYFGLGLLFLAVFGATWIMGIFIAHRVPHWSKTIMAYCTLYILLIYLAQNDYIPEFINQFQISRVVPALALLMVFAFAGALGGVMSSSKKISRGAITIMLLIAAISIVESIKIATIHTSQPAVYMDDPVALHFNDKEIPEGSVYVRDVSSASYFSDQGFRFVTSLNEHLLPHPLSVRFSQFMRSEIAYTGIPVSQIHLINDYVTALGIEYLVLPQTSPLIKSLSEPVPGNGEPQFEIVTDVASTAGSFTILHNVEPIHNAFLISVEDAEMYWDEEMPTPTMHVNSYKEWDRNISFLAQKIRSGKIQSLDLEFVDTDKLRVNLSGISENDRENKMILITQSYDRYWHVSGDRSVVEPSSTRFMIVDPRLAQKNVMLLENNWPKWHWPLEVFGIMLVILLFVLIVTRQDRFFTQISMQQKLSNGNK